jgi:acyl transferase domain-containing protein
MSCRFAGCSSPTALWNAVMARRSCLSAPGSELELPFGARTVFDRQYPVSIGQLGELYSCVPSMQNFPRQVNAGENQDLYFATQLAFDALADASMKPHSREPVRGSVRLGYAPPFNASTVNWLQHTSFLDQTVDIIRRFFPNAPEESLDQVKSKLVESLPAPDASSFLLGTGFRFASWIARECSFSGVSTTMDAGMLTGAVTMMDAVADLAAGRVDVALVGALTPPFSRAYLEGLSGEVPFSPSAGLHPFSSSPSGTAPGEGGAFFVLKRRADALRDRDRIYALVKTVAIGHNPGDDLSSIFSEATERAGVPVKTVGMIEADGTGIEVAERREIEAVHKLWGEHRPGGPLVGIGSIKGNIGHTLRASMAAGIVKAALALHHRVLPPQVEVETPIYSISHLGSSAYLLDDARPWISGDSSVPRRAAVCGANFDAVNPVGVSNIGGRSAVVILEEEPEDRS